MTTICAQRACRGDSATKNVRRCLRRALSRSLAIGAWWVGLAAAPAAELTESAPPGRYTLSVDSSGLERASQVHVPAGYTPDKRLPVVIMLHGAGGNAAGVLDQDGWAAKADNESFLAVAPEGLPASPRAAPNPRSNPQVWNVGQLKAGSARAAIDDVAFVRQLLDKLKTKVPYDESRVFCAGHSNGGAMAFRLAGELSERLAAIGTMGALPFVSDPHPKKPLPTLVLLGMKDPIVPIAGGEVRLPWGKKQSPPVAMPLGAWAGVLDCEVEPATVSDKGGLRKVVYRSKGNGPELTVIYIAGQGHAWPGGQGVLPANFFGPSTKKLDATGAMWDFFSQAAGAAR